MDKIRQFLIKNNYYYLCENPEIFEKFIQRLNVRDILNISTFLNKLLRNKEKENVIAGNMFAGMLVSPPVIIRETILENYLKTLKKISDNKLRAELTYYTFINLHMFSDGNGRTSRLLYGLICGEIEDESWYIHTDEQSNNNGDFCSYKGMLDESKINRQTELLSIPERYVNQYQLLKSVQQYKTYYNSDGSIPINEIVSFNILNQLTDDEKKSIFSIINDNEGYYSIAGLTMLIVTFKNHQLEEWLDRKKDFIMVTNKLSFNLKKDKDLLMLWSLDDWKYLIEIGSKLKCMQFEQLNQIFIEMQNNKKINR